MSDNNKKVSEGMKKKLCHRRRQAPSESREKKKIGEVRSDEKESMKNKKILEGGGSSNLQKRKKQELDEGVKTADKDGKSAYEDESEDSGPEVCSMIGDKRRYYEEEKRRSRGNVRKNPYRCPDLRKPELSEEDEEDYAKWLSYEKGYRGLERHEEGFLQTFAVSNPTGRVTRLP